MSLQKNVFFNHQDVTLNINGKNIFCQNISYSKSNQLLPEYDRNQTLPINEEFGDSRVTSSLDIQYFLIDEDPFFPLLLPIINGQTNISPKINGSIGGAPFDNGYITSYSVNATAPSFLNFSVSIDVYEEIRVAPNRSIINQNPELLNLANTSDSTIQNIDLPISFSLEIEILNKPIFRLGNRSSIPDRIFKNGGQIKFGVQGNELNKIITIEGEKIDVGFSAKSCKGDIQNYSFSEMRITSHSLSLDSNSFLVGGIEAVKFF